MPATPHVPQHELARSLRVAVIGSGPSGCYLTQSLLRGAPGAEITLFDRLPSPFGLIRYGVAADHQHTKRITRQFERLFTAPGVRFAGGVSIGKTSSAELSLELAEIRAHYDVVALATGLSIDRPLGVPGDTLAGVYGAGVITRTLNAHPNERPELPSFGTDVVLVGGGNVALDVLRFLVKDQAGYAESDVADEALAHYLERPAERVTVAIRSGAAEMRSDPALLVELAALPRGRYRLLAPLPEPQPGDDPTVVARLAALTALTAASRPVFPGPEVTLRFCSVPQEILPGDGGTQVASVDFGGAEAPLPATAVITAIGFSREAAGPLAPLLAADAESGRIEPGLYRTGWAKRGPRGAIPENRACAKSVADEILSDLASGDIDLTTEKLGFAGLPEQLQLGSISYAQWTRLDEHEQRHAPAGRTRRKLPHLDHMRSIAQGDVPAAPKSTPTKGTML